MTPAHFTTEARYEDRLSKARYVWEKYAPVLTGSILDVGADECHLRPYLGSETEYIGLGMGGSPDVRFDLESGPLPFPADRFDCVLCLDVLEHVDNAHQVFDELCRVSRRHVIVALPNNWLSFYRRLVKGDDPDDPPMKFYGLPLEPPEDRHKWFFAADEAERFLLYRAGKNGMRVVQLDDYPPPKRRRRTLRQWIRRVAEGWLLRGGFDPRNLQVSTVWAVLEKEDPGVPAP